MTPGIARVGGPAQPVRIAQTVGPDLFLYAGLRRERVVVRNAVTPVVAQRAGRHVFRRIRNDAEDLADQRVESLRVRTRDRPQLARAAVTEADVHHAPFGIAAPSGRMKDHLTHRMDAVVQLHAQHFARGALERDVSKVRVGPLDQHRLESDGPRRDCRCRRLVAERPERQAREACRIRSLRSRQHRALPYGRCRTCRCGDSRDRTGTD